MLSFSHTVGYAILALTCIGSWKGDWVLSKAIHECTGVPMPYLRKILFQLSKKGLIQTKRGYRGGFALTRPPEEISLIEVIHAVEPERPADCVLGLPGCSDATPCPVRHFWISVWAKVEGRLERITLADAGKSVRTGRWGRLAACPPAGHVPKRARAKQTSRAANKGCKKRTVNRGKAARRDPAS